MQAADLVAFTSLDYAKASRYGDLLAAGRIRAVELPNGVDPDRFTPGERPGYLERRHGVVGRRVVLFVGVLDRAHYFKGVPVLLQAMSQLDRADVTLIVVGEGDMRAAYQAAARELGLADRVHFAGFVPDDDLPDYYRLADVTVLPSTTMGEAFGLVLVESLAGGTPVIASALPGVRTVVTPDRDGYLTTPGDVSQLAHKLSQILSLSADRRRAMGLAGRRKVRRRYAWRQIGTRLVGLYRAVVSQRQNETMSSSMEAAT
jgi:glycosyltransferase involved in cell wall biosynthesis